MAAIGDHNPPATTRAPNASSPPAVSSSPRLHLATAPAVDAAASAGQAPGDTTPALDTGECESLALGTDTSADEETSTHRPLEGAAATAARRDLQTSASPKCNAPAPTAGVEQEIYALLVVYQLLRTAMTEPPGPDPTH